MTENFMYLHGTTIKVINI